MKTTFAVIIAFSMLSNAAIGTAADAVSIERGKALFENTKLGKSGKSCATCHPGGKKLEWAGTFDDEKLEEITNRCIQKALQGQPLKEGSDDLKSLILYLKTFAGPN
jgi:cytochrome c